MSLKVSGLPFAGPYLSTDDLDDRSGVYLIVDQADGQNHAIDCGSRQMCGDASHRMIAAIVGRGVRAGNLPLLCVPPPRHAADGTSRDRINAPQGPCVSVRGPLVTSEDTRVRHGLVAATFRSL